MSRKILLFLSKKVNAFEMHLEHKLQSKCNLNAQSTFRIRKGILICTVISILKGGMCQLAFIFKS